MSEARRVDTISIACSDRGLVPSGTVAAVVRAAGSLAVFTRGLRAWATFAVACLSLSPYSSAQPAREYDVKAAFLYNFLSFVEWPPEAFANEEAPFVIGVLGNENFHRVLKNLVDGEVIGQRSCEVRQVQRAEEVEGVHILFVGTSEGWRLTRVFRAARAWPVLTVGDSRGFAQRGGMIEFRSEGDYIRLSINRQRAREAGLRISSKLLQLAQVVGETEAPS